MLRVFVCLRFIFGKRKECEYFFVERDHWSERNVFFVIIESQSEFYELTWRKEEKTG